MKELNQERELYYKFLSDKYVIEANRFVPGYTEEMIPKIISAFSSAGNNMLIDLGCGPGNISLELYESKKPQKFIGVDASEEMIANSERLFNSKGGNVQFVCQDVTEYQFPENTDGVLSSLLLHNIPLDAKKVVLAKIFTSLSSDGVFVWSDLIYFSNKEKQDREFDYRKKFALERGADPDFVEKNFEKELYQDHAITKEEMLYLLKEVGFKKITVLWEKTTFIVISAIK